MSHGVRKFYIVTLERWQNNCHYFPWSITNGASLPIYECEIVL